MDSEYKTKQVKALIELRKQAAQFQEKQKQANKTIDSLINAKIRLESFYNVIQQLEAGVELKRKDLNAAIESIQNNSEQSKNIISTVDAGLNYFVTVEAANKLNGLKTILKKIKLKF